MSQSPLHLIIDMKSLEFEIEKWKSRLDEKFRMFVGYYESDELKETARHFFELGKESNNKSLTSKNTTTMDKKKFGYIFMAGMCMLPTIILLILWFANGGKVVEANMFEEVAKWVFGDAALTLFIALPFGYILAPFVWHCIYDKRGKDSGSQD